MKTALQFDGVVLRTGVSFPDLKIRRMELCVIAGMTELEQDSLIHVSMGGLKLEKGRVIAMGYDSLHESEKAWFQLISEIAILDSQATLDEDASVCENIARVFQGREDPLKEPALSKAVLRSAETLKFTITELGATARRASPLILWKTRLGRVLAGGPKILFVKDVPAGPEIRDDAIAVLRRVRRKLKLTVIAFTSNSFEGILPVDRMLDFDRGGRSFIEKAGSRWYHRLLHF